MEGAVDGDEWVKLAAETLLPANGNDMAARRARALVRRFGFAHAGFGDGFRCGATGISGKSSGSAHPGITQSIAVRSARSFHQNIVQM
jgi:hypothetical protein